MERYLLLLLTGCMVVLGTVFEVRAWDLSGQVAFESRGFTQGPAFVGQRTAFYYPSLMVSPELRHVFWNGSSHFTLVPFLRLEAYNTQRTHWDIREFNWQYTSGEWDLKAGVVKTFWGVTEARHLVDIINQSDYLEDIDLEDKLGQPMVNLNFNRPFGKVSVFYMPYFRERRFQNRSGRFRPFLPIDDRQSQYESSSKHWHQDFAVRWSRTLGAWDLGVAHFQGTSREPTLLLDSQDPANPVFIPRYEVISQTSLDVQFIQGAWLWKLEAITRGGQSKRFQAAVVGGEYTMYGLGGSGVDLSLFGEYLYDGRDRIKDPPTLYNNDIFTGARIAINDVAGTEVQVGLVQDLEDAGKFVNLEARRRIDNTWKIEMKARFFVDAQFNDFVLYSFHRDDYVQLRISRYF